MRLSTFQARLRDLCSGCTLLILAAGCGEQTLPKGTGASGRIVGVLPKPDTGLELINKFTPEQQKAHEWLHQPFDKAVLVADRSKESIEPLRSVKDGWETLTFADEKNNLRYVDFAELVTNVGTIHIDLNTAHSPNHTRNLLLLLQKSFFDGAKVTIAEGVAWIGTPADQETYYLASETFDMIPVKGAIVARLDDTGRSRGTQIGISLDTLPDLRTKVTILAGVAGEIDNQVVDRIRSKIEAEPGSVFVEKFAIARKTSILFAVDGVRLPTLGPDGKPDVITKEVGQQNGMPTGFNMTSPAGTSIIPIIKPAPAEPKPQAPARVKTKR